MDNVSAALRTSGDTQAWKSRLMRLMSAPLGVCSPDILASCLPKALTSS